MKSNKNKKSCNKLKLLSDYTLGSEFTQELDKILKIREERRKVYSDIFLKETPEALLNIIDGKRNRFNMLFNVKNRTEFQQDKLIDEARDIVNYYIFLLCVLHGEEEDEEDII